ncbi:MAG: hypothetical protein S0880_23730 [Actinomycetota bacterium]|nr:hypothetical protein [Actinomycetota bacterium]
MTTIEPSPTAVATLHVHHWPDPVIDQLGHDPRSWYAERFWLPVLGPTAMWLLRRFVDGLDTAPDGFCVDPDVWARSLGVKGGTGRHAPFSRTVLRLCQFGAATRHAQGLAVRRRLAPLAAHQLTRLPEELRVEHEHWRAAHEDHVATTDPARAGRLAEELVGLGLPRDTVAVHLRRLVGPTTADRVLADAWDLRDVLTA